MQVRGGLCIINQTLIYPPCLFSNKFKYYMISYLKSFEPWDGRCSSYATYSYTGILGLITVSVFSALTAFSLQFFVVFLSNHSTLVKPYWIPKQQQLNSFYMHTFLSLPRLCLYIFYTVPFFGLLIFCCFFNNFKIFNDKTYIIM